MAKKLQRGVEFSVGVSANMAYTQEAEVCRRQPSFPAPNSRRLRLRVFHFVLKIQNCGWTFSHIIYVNVKHRTVRYGGCVTEQLLISISRNHCIGIHFEL